MGNKTKWMLLFFGALVLIANAYETYQFGANYIAGAFGAEDEPIARLAAGAYVLLMLDAAFMVWFAVWLAGEQSTEQRDVALILAITALVGSIAATVTQLAINTTLAPYLIPFRPTIGTIAFFLILLVTVGHILGLAAHKYFTPSQRVASKTAEIQANVINDALKELEAQARKDADIVVNVLAGEFRLDLLNALGFSGDLQRIGKGNEQKILPATTLSENESDFDLEALVDFLVEENLKEREAENQTVPLNGSMSN